MAVLKSELLSSLNERDLSLRVTGISCRRKCCSKSSGFLLVLLPQKMVLCLKGLVLMSPESSSDQLSAEELWRELDARVSSLLNSEEPGKVTLRSIRELRVLDRFPGMRYRVGLDERPDSSSMAKSTTFAFMTGNCRRTKSPCWPIPIQPRRC